MKVRIAVATTLVSAGALGWPPPTARADGLTCGFEATLRYERPVTLANQDANFVSEVGIVTCGTGTSTLRLEGTAGEAPFPAGGHSCLRGAGFGRITVGAQGGRFAYRKFGPVWTIEGTLSDERAFTLVGVEPTSLTCPASPNPSSALSGQIVLGAS